MSDAVPSTYDVVIVGHGAAGLSAAVSAKEQHPRARVLVLERTDRAERGGNTRWSGAYLRADSVERIAASFEDDFSRFSDGASDPDYVRRLATEAPAALSWLESLGCRFSAEPMFFLSSDRPRLGVKGGGAAIVETLERRAAELGVEIAFESTAQELVLDAGGRVTGIRVTTDGTTRTVAAHAVVLASGGFQGSPELLGRHLGEALADLPTVARGGRYDKGEGLEMALAAGGELAGEAAGFHCEPVDPRSEKSQAINMLFPYGVLVNGRGERFVDEGEKTVDECYEAITRLIAEQPGHLAYLVTDEDVFGIDGWQRAVLSDREPVRATSVAELAGALDIDGRALTQTLGAFNTATAANRLQDRNPFGLDGLATTDLTPPKSNWAVPVDTTRLVAWPLTTAIVFTFGGIRVDADARVVGSDGSPLPGLFAAGECTGAYHHKYPGATSVMRAVTFGRIAGRAAAKTRVAVVSSASDPRP